MPKTRRDRDYLADIANSLERIAVYTRGLTYNRFMRDHKTQDAVVRNLEVIGEAAKKVGSNFRRKHPDVPWKEMAGLRDRLIHDYLGINYEIVWNIAATELPGLLGSVKQILAGDTESSQCQV